MGLAALKQNNDFSSENIYVADRIPNSKIIDLRKARQIYLARSLTAPAVSISNVRLSLLRRLAWTLIIFQILDGLLTLHGISIFGIEAEGNPLIRSLLEICGAAVGIGLVKLLAISIIFLICIYGSHLAWLTRALKFVCSVYFLFALLPWTFAFSSYYGASLGIF